MFPNVKFRYTYIIVIVGEFVKTLVDPTRVPLYFIHRIFSNLSTSKSLGFFKLISKFSSFRLLRLNARTCVNDGWGRFQMFPIDHFRSLLNQNLNQISNVGGCNGKDPHG